MLEQAGYANHSGEMREWYDGYRFGDLDIYCPWDVVNYVNSLLLDSSAAPKNYWENTSDNAVVRSLLDRADLDITDKYETLLGGGYIKVSIVDGLTYDMP